MKGAPLRAFLELLVREWGDPRLERIAPLLDADTAAVLRLDPSRPGYGVLPGTWYPTSAAERLISMAMSRTPATAREERLREIAATVMKETISGVHHALFRVVGSPALMERYHQRFWNAQFDGGRVEVITTAPGEQRHEYHEWPGHEPLVCRFAFVANEPLFRMMGVRDPRVELVQCVASGAPFCSAFVRWRA